MDLNSVAHQAVLDPLDRPDTCVLVCKTLYTGRRYREALALLDTAVARYPCDVQLLHLRGLCLQANNHHPAAFATLMSVLTIDARHVPSLCAVGSMYKARGMLQEAMAAYQQALEASGPDTYNDIAAALAMVYTDMGNKVKVTGSPQEALTYYQKALEVCPGSATAHYHMGVAYSEMKQMDLALTCYQQAIRCCPTYAEAHCNIGVICKDRGDLEGAIACYERALDSAPNFAIVKSNLAIALTDMGTRVKLAGQLQEGISLYERALTCNPRYADALYNLGVAHGEAGNIDRAIFMYEMAVQCNPACAEAYNNLGVIYKERDNLERAIECYTAALTVKPNFPQSLNNMGVILTCQGRAQEALTLLTAAIASCPTYAEAHNNLGVLQRDVGAIPQALASYAKCLELCPESRNAGQNRLLALNYIRFGDEEEVCRAHAEWGLRFQALFKPLPPLGPADRDLSLNRPLRVGYISPDLYTHSVSYFAEAPLAHHMTPLRYQTLRAAGSYPLTMDTQLALLGASTSPAAATQPIQLAQSAVAQVEDAVMAGEDSSTGAISVNLEHGNAGQGQACGVAAEFLGSEPPRAVEPGLQQLGTVETQSALRGSLGCRRFGPGADQGGVNPEQRQCLVQHYVYCCAPKRDSKTAKLKAGTLAAHGVWREVTQMAEPDLARLVREDEIDILVELTGHTANNRLGVMAMSPAPVQVTWIGYPNSTGLEAVHYRISDEYADPWDTTQTYVEQLVRMPGGTFLCYTPSVDAPPVAPTPALASGFVTFGSFNNLAKITPEVLEVWARILKAVPGSRLVLKNKPFACETAKLHVLNQLAAQGVDSWRVDLLPLAAGNADHLATYALMDISLDTFPYAGTTTTCESLYMGVPCLTLQGRGHAHNVGVSLLTSVDLQQDWVAHSTDEYVAMAVEHAKDVRKLTALRESLRERMMQSRLCDAPSFVRGLEHVYHDMWAAHVAKVHGVDHPVGYLGASTATRVPPPAKRVALEAPEVPARPAHAVGGVIVVKDGAAAVTGKGVDVLAPGEHTTASGSVRTEQQSAVSLPPRLPSDCGRSTVSRPTSPGTPGLPEQQPSPAAGNSTPPSRNPSSDGLAV